MARINIEIDLDSSEKLELNALAALIAALGGRAGPIVTALAEEAAPVESFQHSYVAIPVEVKGDARAPEDTPVVPEALLNEKRPTEPAPVVVPPPPPATSTAPVASVDTDSEGLPWDARIHAATKRQTQDGKWARRRNTDDALWESVRASLKATMGAPASVPQPPADSPLVAPYAIAPDPAAAFGAPVVPPPPPVPNVPPPPPAPAVTESAAGAATTASNGDDFTRILTKVVGMQTAGTITAEQVQQICAQLGLPEGVRSLMNRPDLLPQFEMLIGG